MKDLREAKTPLERKEVARSWGLCRSPRLEKMGGLSLEKCWDGGTATVCDGDLHMGT